MGRLWCPNPRHRGVPTTPPPTPESLRIGQKSGTGVSPVMQFGHFLVCIQSPEGRTENSPGLQAWEPRTKRIALKGRPNPDRRQSLLASKFLIPPNNHRRFSYRKQIRKLLTPSTSFWRTFSLATTPDSRPPFQGDSLLGTFPGLKAWAVLFSPFGRSKDQTPVPRIGFIVVSSQISS